MLGLLGIFVSIMNLQAFVNYISEGMRKEYGGRRIIVQVCGVLTAAARKLAGKGGGGGGG